MSLFETISALVTLFLAWWSPITPSISPSESVTALVVSVVDGDTIIVTLSDSEAIETVRYIGIDTPEPRREGEPECGSNEASDYNRQLVKGKTVRLESDVEDRDKYGRLLRYVYVTENEGEEVFVNEALIRAGFARPLTIVPNTVFAADFEIMAQKAAFDLVGNWALCTDF